jgi:hypothetical protein
MDALFAALKSYAYGMGWLCLAVIASVIGLWLLDRLGPLNLRSELERQNPAVAVVVGLYLLGLTFGILYMAAHL